jgi:phage terminase large subunit-like protein
VLDLSCRDWEARIRAGQSLLPTIPVHEGEARRAVGIFNRLHLPDVPGQPSFAEAGADWFREIVSAVFGAVVLGPAGDRIAERLIRELFLLVPKKNSKTTNGAALGMTALLLNRRPRAEHLLIGPTQEVAKLAFSQAVGMIEADPEGYLQKRFQPKEADKEIIDRRTKATLKIKSFDPSVLTGTKPVFVLLDEVHEIGKSPHASRIVGQIRGGIMPNAEGFFAMITTQSDEPPAGVFRDELNKARAVRDGRLKGTALLPVLYEFPTEIAAAAPAGQTPKWHDPSLWWMVTPNRDRSVTIARLEQEFTVAQAVGLAEVVRWASQHLNIEIGLGLRTDRWRGADHWQAAAEPGLDLAGILARCDVVTAGIDGGGLDDLFALTLVGRERETRRWLQWTRAWAHRGVLELRKGEAARLLDFESDGDLVFVDDMEDAFAAAAAIVASVREADLLAQVGLDPMGVGSVVDALAAVEVEGDKTVVGISQGWTLNGAIKTAEVKLANGTLVHCGQGLMSYAVGNAKTEPKGNAITITKALAGAGKIDPLMATFNAVALMSRNPTPTVRTIEQGFVVL